MDKDFTLALMSGIDIPFLEIQDKVHQPTIKEIAYIGEEEFFLGVQYLCINKDAYGEPAKDLSNFQLLMQLINLPKNKEMKKSIFNLLTILFPDKKIFFTPRSILLDKAMIDNSTFDIFQKILKLMFCVGAKKSGANADFNPANKKAEEIAKKLMAARVKVSDEANSSNVLTRYVSILTVGVDSMPLQQVLQLTVYQLYDLFERFMLKFQWEIDMKIRLAGGTPADETESWLENIH